jgi:hypothetical protein
LNLVPFRHRRPATGRYEQRIRRGSMATLPIRGAAALAIAAGLIVGTGWAFGGPLEPGW